MSQVDDQSVPSALYDIGSLFLPFANVGKSTTFTSYNSSDYYLVKLVDPSASYDTTKDTHRVTCLSCNTL